MKIEYAIECAMKRSQGLFQRTSRRFDVANSSLPDAYKERLLALRGQRIAKDGVIVLKAQCGGTIHS